MSALEKPVYRFSDFELDPHERRLLSHGEAITLTPKVFDTLVLLVEQAGHVVGKDELMHALWPRGFVDESNLTKHIWLIRKALGDNEHGAGCIETVPKRGYRFAAPVTRIAEQDGTARNGHDAAVIVDAPPDGSRDNAPGASADRTAARLAQLLAAGPSARASVAGSRARRMWTGGISIALLVIAGVALWRYSAREMAVPVDASGNAIAIVAFNNLSQKPADAWLGAALGEMLATELATSGRVHVLPDELVRPARADLPAPLAGGYANASLGALRKRLGTDYVLSGSYLVSGSGDKPQLRLDLALQDARAKAAIATVTRSGAVADLPALVIQTGVALREKLGLPSASSGQLQQVAAAQPPTAEVARRVGLAIDALRRDDPARARDELLDAVAQAPGFAPAYSYLAQAWAALGYGSKSLAAAEQAAAHAEGLPEEQRLQIRAQVEVARHDWPRAVQTHRALVTLRPQNPEYRFQLVTALIADGKAEVAQDEVRRLTPQVASARDDPRLELVQAQVAAAREDSKQRAAHAERALQLARTREATGLAAAAGMELGIARSALGDATGAEQALMQARADYVHVGNPRGAAWSDQNLGNVYSGHDPARARDAYARALTGYQAIGDRDGEAQVQSDLGIMLWGAGDLDGTETAVRKALAIRRETGDLAGQAWNLVAVAIVESDAIANDAVANEYREAIVLDERAGERAHRAFSLMQLSDLERLRGNLGDAAQLCAQGLAVYRAIDNASGVASASMQCALVALDRGDTAAAAAETASAETANARFAEPVIVTNAGLMQAQISMGRGDWKGAIAPLNRVIVATRTAEVVTGEAIAQAFLALCQAKLGNAAERDRAATRAKALRSRITEHQEVFAVDIAIAQLRGLTGQPEAAITTLRELAADADKRGWLGWTLETRLALLDVLESRHDASAAAQRSALLADARTHGFGWIAQRAQAVHASDIGTR